MAQESNDVKQELVAIADELDRRGLKEMADEVTQILAEIVHEERVAALPDPEYLVEVADQLDREGRYDEADNITAYAQRVAMVRTAGYWDTVRDYARGGAKAGAGVGGAVGGLAGAGIGGFLGGAAGTPLMPGVGTVAGGIAGGLGGAAVGGAAGAGVGGIAGGALSGLYGMGAGGAQALGNWAGGQGQAAQQTANLNLQRMQMGQAAISALRGQIGMIDQKINALRAKNPNDPQIKVLQQQKLGLMQKGYQTRQQGDISPNAPVAVNPQEQAQYAKQYGLQTPATA